MHTLIQARRSALLGALLLLLPAAARADDKPKDEPRGKPDQPLVFDDFSNQRAAVMLLGAGMGAAPLHKALMLGVGEQLRFWDFQPPVLSDELRVPVGATSVAVVGAGTGTPGLSAAGVLFAGDFADCWSVEDFNRARALPRETLAAVRDDRPLARPDEPTPDGVVEYAALHDALIKMLRSPAAAFDRVARTSLWAGDLADAPARFRGAVVRLEGQIKRVRRVPARPLLDQIGIDHLYEVWAESKMDGRSRLACVLCTRLPEGVDVGDEVPGERGVALVGYFFKRWRFPKESGVKDNPERTAVLLIGHALPWISPRVKAAAAASSALLAGTAPDAGPTMAVRIQAGERVGLWEVRDPTQVPRLDREPLDGVRDQQPMPTDLDESEQGLREWVAYCEALVNAHRTPAGVFQKAVLPDVTYAHLHNQPRRYRGEVVRIEGRLRIIRRFDPMYMVRQVGVKDLYECWLINDQFEHANPACLITTTLPRGFRPSEKVEGTVRVSFVGYFFKKYRYKGGDGLRDVPLLIGHLVPTPEPAEAEESSWTSGLLPLFFTVLGGTFILVAVFTWGFRRADHRVRRRLDESLFISADDLPTPADPIDEATEALKPPDSSPPQGAYAPRSPESGSGEKRGDDDKGEVR